MRYIMHFGPEALRIDMEGVLSFRDWRTFNRMMTALALKEARNEIWLNLGRLEKIDCTGLQLLMQAHDLAKKTHRTLVFEGAKGQVLEALSSAAECNYLCIVA